MGWESLEYSIFKFSRVPVTFRKIGSAVLFKFSFWTFLLTLPSSENDPMKSCWPYEWPTVFSSFLVSRQLSKVADGCIRISMKRRIQKWYENEICLTFLFRNSTSFLGNFVPLALCNFSCWTFLLSLPSSENDPVKSCGRRPAAGVKNFLSHRDTCLSLVIRISLHWIGVRTRNICR